MNKHTDTPWRKGVTIENTDYGVPIFEITIFSKRTGIFTIKSTYLEEVEANAEFIVKACNLHDELVEELNNLVKRIEGVIKDETYVGFTGLTVYPAKQLLTKAEAYND